MVLFPYPLIKISSPASAIMGCPSEPTAIYLALQFAIDHYHPVRTSCWSCNNLTPVMSSRASQLRISRYAGPPMFPGPAIFVLFVTSQIYIHLSSSSYALTARDAIERALGRGVMKGLGQLILGIVSSQDVRLSPDAALKLTGRTL